MTIFSLIKPNMVVHKVLKYSQLLLVIYDNTLFFIQPSQNIKRLFDVKLIISPKKKYTRFQ